jgi:hypothetical protein
LLLQTIQQANHAQNDAVDGVDMIGVIYCNKKYLNKHNSGVAARG